ncbi:hypothetical protein ACP70R_032297 [Stipagrostis hirtigluma subsp. patula]
MAPTASTIVTREVTESHTITIDGCAPSRKLPSDKLSASRTFAAAGYHWRILYRPAAAAAVPGAWWWSPVIRSPCISLHLELDAAYDRTDPVEVRFSLLDRAGIPVTKHTRTAEACVFGGETRRRGFDDFIRWSDLEASGCLAGDRFSVRCDVSVIRDWAEDAGAAAVPPPKLHEHLYDLLYTRKGSDVVIDVGGEAFHAHRWLLAMRSPAFEAELLASMAATKADDGEAPGAGAGDVPRAEIRDMEPSVFRALLRFMYTDKLPQVEERDAVSTARGLLAAAHRFELERLKPMCEEMLRERISVGTVAGTLAAAERHGCRALKAACVEFIAYPGNLKKVMETEGFEKIKADYPALMMELVMKQLAA